MCRAMLVCVPFGMLLGQASLPSFEVASIKPANPDGRNGTLVNLTPGGGLRVVNATLQDLIETGYQVRKFQIVGGSRWTATAKYDVTATSGREGGPQPQAGSSEARLKVKTLLKDRFQLQIHRETRDSPIYSLVVAKNGIKASALRRSTNTHKGINASPTSMLGEAASMTDLASKLSNRLERPVANNTGLDGTYDFTLEWSPDPGAPAPEDKAVDSSSGPSVFTALQEQLGLKLEPTKGPVEVLVIDHAEKPSEN